MIPQYCQNCGAVMSFDPTAHMVQCDSCGTIWYADEDASVKKERLQNEREKQRMQHERDSRADEFFYREKLIKEMEDRNRRKAVFWGKVAGILVIAVLLVIGAGFAIYSVIHKNDIKLKCLLPVLLDKTIWLLNKC